MYRNMLPFAYLLTNLFSYLLTYSLTYQTAVEQTDVWCWKCAAGCWGRLRDARSAAASDAPMLRISPRAPEYEIMEQKWSNKVAYVRLPPSGILGFSSPTYILLKKWAHL